MVPNLIYRIVPSFTNIMSKSIEARVNDSLKKVEEGMVNNYDNEKVVEYPKRSTTANTNPMAKGEYLEQPKSLSQDIIADTTTMRTNPSIGEENGLCAVL